MSSPTPVWAPNAGLLAMKVLVLARGVAFEKQQAGGPSPKEPITLWKGGMVVLEGSPLGGWLEDKQGPQSTSRLWGEKERDTGRGASSAHLSWDSLPGDVCPAGLESLTSTLHTPLPLSRHYGSLKLAFCLTLKTWFNVAAELVKTSFVPRFPQARSRDRSAGSQEGGFSLPALTLRTKLIT